MLKGSGRLGSGGPYGAALRPGPGAVRRRAAGGRDEARAVRLREAPRAVLRR
ncbi:hypothetical protein GCM10010466_51660 [Planomonospora alba]|uniref:Uncharacterized protein n=1 Tax=Planomonospora alba TaxID=161354 RepID=A0ABP6NNW5_9ACTN